SDEDLRWLYGEGREDAAAQRMLTSGVKLVAVTLGSQGVRGYQRDGVVDVQARKAEVADTVGAGDTFNAGLLAALYEGGELTKKALAELPTERLGQALDMGARAAAVTVSRSGANPPWRNEI
ncbi:MAG: carbohydrate kinase family protein, partial [Gammaproteobacteria bacterium]